MIAPVTGLPDLLVILTFLRILLTPSLNVSSVHYNTVLVFVDLENTYADSIIETVNLVVPNIPVMIRSFEEGSNRTAVKVKQDDQPKNLNLFVVHSASELQRLQRVQRSLYISDQRLVLLTSMQDDEQLLLSNIRRYLAPMMVFVVLRPNGDLFWIRLLQTEHIVQYQLNLTSIESIREVMHSIHTWQEKDVPHWNAIIFIQYYAPYSLMAPIYDANNQFMATELVGPDPLMAYDVARQLNATALICTDMAREQPDYENIFRYRNSIKDAYVRLLVRMKYLKHVALKRLAYDYDYRSPYADLYVTSKMVENRQQRIASHDKVECYPHSIDCLCVVVPQSKRRQIFLLEIIKHPSLWAILITFGVFVILRRAVTDEPVPDLILTTMGFLLAQHYHRQQVRPSECLWLVFMLVFALFSTTILSSMLYVSLVHFHYEPEIDTVEQLAASGLNILINENSTEDSWDFSK